MNLYETLQHAPLFALQHPTEGEDPPTFVVARLVNLEDGLQLTTALVDPDCPESGGAQEFLDRTPSQRAALEAMRILDIVSPALTAQARIHELRLELGELSPNDLVRGVTQAINLLLSERFKELDHEPT